MKYLTIFLFLASLVAAYITPPDQVLIAGRILLTGSRPMASFPWSNGPPRLSEHPFDGASDSRELEAIWEIKDGRLYLLAVSAYRLDGSSHRQSVGLQDLMPDRVQDGRVLADWFSGDFVVIERARVDWSKYQRPEDAPPMQVFTRTFHVENGQVTEELN